MKYKRLRAPSSKSFAVVTCALAFSFVPADALASGPSPLDLVQNAETLEEKEKLMRESRAYVPPHDSPPTPEQWERLLKYYIATENPAVVEKLGPDLVVRLAAKYKRELNTPVAEILFSNLRKTVRFASPPYQIKKVADSALAEGINSTIPGVRCAAISWYFENYGETATDDVLRLLDDPDQSVRVWATEALGKYGRPDAAPRIVQILNRRVRELNAEEVESDATLRFGREAIIALRKRGEKQLTKP